MFRAELQGENATDNTTQAWQHPIWKLRTTVVLFLLAALGQSSTVAADKKDSESPKELLFVLPSDGEFISGQNKLILTNSSRRRGEFAIALANGANGKVIAPISAEPNRDGDVAYSVSNDGRTLLTIGNKIETWGTTDGRRKRTISESEPPFLHTKDQRPHFVMDDSRIFGIGNAFDFKSPLVVKAFDFQLGKQIWSEVVSPKNASLYRAVYSTPPIAISPDKKQLAFAYEGSVGILSCETGKLLKSWDVPNRPIAIDFSGDSKTLICVTHSCVLLFEATAEAKPREIKCQPNFAVIVRDVDSVLFQRQQLDGNPPTPEWGIASLNLQTSEITALPIHGVQYFRVHPSGLAVIYHLPDKLSFWSIPEKKLLATRRDLGKRHFSISADATRLAVENRVYSLTKMFGDSLPKPPLAK